MTAVPPMNGQGELDDVLVPVGTIGPAATAPLVVVSDVGSEPAAEPVVVVPVIVPLVEVVAGVPAVAEPEPGEVERVGPVVLWVVLGGLEGALVDVDGRGEDDEGPGLGVETAGGTEAPGWPPDPKAKPITVPAAGV